MLKIKKSASITVETAFVFPFVVFLIIALLYLGFWLHDEVCLQAAFHRVGGEMTEGEISEMETEINGKLCITKIERVQMKKHLLSIKISYQKTRRIRGILLYSLFEKQKGQTAIKILVYEPMKTVRSLGGIRKDESDF